jgi:hypothetical protein
MRTILVVGGLFFVAASLIADYKWRQWMAARRRERDAGPSSGRHNF